MKKATHERSSHVHSVRLNATELQRIIENWGALSKLVHKSTVIHFILRKRLNVLRTLSSLSQDQAAELVAITEVLK